jgi:hypothetical protein
VSEGSDEEIGRLKSSNAVRREDFFRNARLCTCIGLPEKGESK